MKTTPQPPIPQPQMPTAPPAWQPQPSFPPQLSGAPPAPYAQPPGVVVKSEEHPAGLNPFPAPSTQNTSDNIANLLSTLVKAGVVSSSSTPVGADTSAQQSSGAKDSLLPGPSAESIREYRNTVLSESINLNVLDSVA